MHRALAVRHWPRGRVSSSSNQLRALQPVQLPSSSSLVSKRTLASLGISSAGLEPPGKSLTPCLIMRPTIPLARCYSSRPARFAAKPSNQPAKPADKLEFVAPPPTETPEPNLPTAPAEDPAQRAQIIDSVDRAKQQILEDTGIPTQEDVLSVFLKFHKAAELATGFSISQGTGQLTDSETAASSLLSLDGSSPKPSQAPPSQASSPIKSSALAEYISNAAFQVITHPTVNISQQVLEAYVVTQARLGKAESLPYVLSLYASKPRPRSKSGSIKYVTQDPHTPAAAVPTQIIEKALDAAIEAKDLDAAVGVVENTYGTKAFQRQKLLRKALLPTTLAAMLPWGVYTIAAGVAPLQHSWDHETATFVVGAALMTYVLCTATLGLVALVTSNDQMRRVTYAPGLRLRERWLREDQRAAYDKVASSFGFSEASKFGEEEGQEFRVLRQFLLRRGMMLDRVELMEGMS